jgi:hypothetical protein
MPVIVGRWRYWYAESRANGHGRLWSARWAARVAWLLHPGREHRDPGVVGEVSLARPDEVGPQLAGADAGHVAVTVAGHAVETFTGR